MQKNDFTPELRLEKESESKQKGFGKYLYYGRQPYPKKSITSKKLPTFSADEIKALKSRVTGKDETSQTIRKQLDSLPKSSKESQQTKTLLKRAGALDDAKTFENAIKKYYKGNPEFYKYSDEGMETNKKHLNALKRGEYLGKMVEKYKPLQITDQRTGLKRTEFVDEYVKRLDEEIKKARPKGQHVLRKERLDKYLDNVYQSRSVTRGNVQYPFFEQPSNKKDLSKFFKRVKNYVANMKGSKDADGLYDPSKDLKIEREALNKQGAYLVNPEYVKLDQEYKKQLEKTTTRKEATQKRKEGQAKARQTRARADLAIQTSEAKRNKNLALRYASDINRNRFSNDPNKYMRDLIKESYSQPPKAKAVQTKTTTVNTLKLADDLKKDYKVKPRSGGYGSVGGGYFMDRIGGGSMIGRRKK